MPETWLHRPHAGAPCTVVAEVAQAHEGSLGIAHAYIDCAARAGADAVKFQTHIAEAESTPDEPWRKAFSTQDRTRFEYWKRMEFTPPHWKELRAHADERGLLFLSSPFSLEAVDLLRDVGVAGWKIASGETGNDALLDAVAASGQPVILSSGMSPMAEIDAAVARVRARGVPLAVLQCTSAYPCPPELVGLNVLAELRERHGCATGLSDHSGTIFPGLAAATLGAQVLEVHLTFSREMFGPDVPVSLTPDELRTLVTGVRFIEAMRAHPVRKDDLPESVRALRSIFTKSAVLARDLPAGAVLGPRDLVARKPGSGIPANRIPALAGRRLARAVRRWALLREDDLEPETP